MQKFRRTLEGRVLSNKMEKTAVIEVVRRVKHPLFLKYFLKRKKYKAHDEKNACQIGDLVRMTECPPKSREKRWAVVEILKKGIAV